MVKIRLSLQGTKKNPFYKIIVTDSRSPRDGKFIEQIGFFQRNAINPSEKTNLNMERLEYWIKNGAIPTKIIKNIINKIKK